MSEGANRDELSPYARLAASLKIINNYSTRARWT